jgi:uncharacterized membrane protein
VEKKFEHISPKLIGSLSDGVFAIAITLLGLDVVGLVPEISKSENVNLAIIENWPTFFAYILGFVVLFSTWYRYHAVGQYITSTNTWLVWQQGMDLAWVALMPFGVSMLARNLGTPQEKWGVFYFGICLFGNYWTTLILLAIAKFDFKISYDHRLPVPLELMGRITQLATGLGATVGLCLVITALAFDKITILGYGIYVAANLSPVRTLNGFMGILVRSQSPR